VSSLPITRTTCLLALLTVGGAAAADAEKGVKETVSLFNGKDLTGWRTYLDPSKKTQPSEIWSISDGVIHCKGSVAGYLLTEKEYDNYVLRFQWRFPPGSKGGNSGCFVHVVGPDKVWPKGIEAQLMHKQAGDFWLVDGAKLKIDEARHDPKSERHYYRLKKDEAIEKPIGEWNQYEITCDGNNIKLVVNGHFVNEGTDGELSKGRILLQSEGAPIEFRNIELTPLKK
jgi:hypothetical protein